ncbi:hypothetical protein EG329_008918 [Mollisiaceae sp. DMI_Dod_QoI]|nr:hypothetical protein EG329_008918 [Helotiales sp. DMI_Dod_QoI]
MPNSNISISIGSNGQSTISTNGRTTSFGGPGIGGNVNQRTGTITENGVNRPMTDDEIDEVLAGITGIFNGVTGCINGMGPSSASLGQTPPFARAGQGSLLRPFGSNFPFGQR